MPNPVPRKPERNRHKSVLTRTQSGDDWGMDTSYEDWMNEPDPTLGMTDEEMQNFDWNAYMLEQGDPPKDPGEPDSSGFSTDFTDSGIQSSVDPEDAEIDAYEKSLITKKRSMGASSIPIGGGGAATGATRRKVHKKSALTRKV